MIVMLVHNKRNRKGSERVHQIEGERKEGKYNLFLSYMSLYLCVYVGARRDITSREGEF